MKVELKLSLDSFSNIGTIHSTLKSSYFNGFLRILKVLKCKEEKDKQTMTFNYVFRKYLKF